MDAAPALQALVDVQSVKGGHLGVLCDNGFRPLGTADAERQALCWSIDVGLKSRSAHAEALAFANHAGDRLMPARFSDADDTTVSVGYLWPAAGGVPAALAIRQTYRRPRVMAQALADLDENHVLG